MFIIITFLRSSWLPGKSLTCSLRNNGECREYSTSFGIIHDSLKNFLRWPMGAYASERISRVQQVTFDLPTEWNWVKQKYFYFRQLALPCSWATRITFPFLISKFYREVIIIKIISLSPKVNSLGVLTIVFYRGKRKIYTCFGTNNNVPDISDLRSGEKQWLHFVAIEFFSRALLTERLKKAKRLVNEYICSMNYYNHYGLYHCCSYYN